MMLPHPCTGPYIRATLDAAEERGLWHLAAFAREQWERHVFGGVYLSYAFGHEAVVTPVPACRYCAERT